MTKKAGPANLTIRFHPAMAANSEPSATFQGGATLEAERIGPTPAMASKWTPTDVELKDYVGNYPVTPKFGLRIFADGAELSVQGTNQRSLKLVPVERDVFVAESVGAEIDFARDAADKIVSLTLKQRGQVLRGERHQDAASEPNNH